MRRIKDRKLTGMILAALLCTGGSLINTSLVYAGNSVTVNAGDIVNNVYNGVTDPPAADPSTADLSGEQTGHTATIEGTVSKNVYGGYSSNNNASGNTVTINGGTVGTDVNDSLVGGSAGGGSADNNTVTINGGTINATVWGGKGVGGTSVSGNTVTISGSPTFGAGVLVHGGVGEGDIKDNTVNILSTVQLAGLIGNESWGSGTVSGNTLNIAV